MSVIGLDFGNFCSYVSYIEDIDFDNVGRLGGLAKDLISPQRGDAIPSVFFYNSQGQYYCTRQANSAKPAKNRIRYLKNRKFDEVITDENGVPVYIDGRQWHYSDAIRVVIESILHEANEELHHQTLETSNLVSLAYPATFDSGKLEKLKSIIESIQIDGRNYEVVGTVAEPAAAALDYLSRADCQGKDEFHVLVFDLGGGTFDVALVTCYPNGRQKENGGTTYYDIVATDGIDDLGGQDFDRVVFELLKEKTEKEIGHPISEHIKDQLRNNAETVKKELSYEDYAVCSIVNMDNYIDIEITREAFEEHPQVQEMLSKMIEKTKEVIYRPNVQIPNIIVLTGGGSRMPMIRSEVAAKFPSFDLMDNIVTYKPETAISFGAARFGIREDIGGLESIIAGDTYVIKRTRYDLGVRYVRNTHDETGFVATYVQKGTEIPCETEWRHGETLWEGARCNYGLYEARISNPDPNDPNNDYTRIKSLSVEFGRVLPAGTHTEARLVIDRNGFATFEARENENTRSFSVEVTPTLDQ